MLNNDHNDINAKMLIMLMIIMLLIVMIMLVK